MKIKDLNLEKLKEKIDVDESEKLFEQFQKEIAEEVGQITPEEIRKSKYPNDVCPVCNQLGCNYNLKQYNKKYHKKCFNLLIRKSRAYAFQKFKRK